MAKPEENVNPFPRLYTKRPWLSLEELFSTPSHRGVPVRVIKELAPGPQPQDQEEVARYIAAVRRVNIGKVDMARTPYVTVRGAEPVPPAPQPKETTMVERRDLSAASYSDPQQQEKPEDEGPPQAEVEEPKPVKLNAEEVNELLDVVHNTADLPSLLALNQAAMINLTIMAKEVQEELDKRAEEAQKKAEELQAKIVAWKQKKEEQRKKEEKEAKEKADAA